VKREAERLAARIESELSTGTTTAPHSARSKTFAQVTAESLAASRSRLKPGTLAQYENLYASRVLPTFGAKRIAAITSQEVEKWVAGLVAAGLAPNTVHNHYVALNKVFRYAERHRLIGHNPCGAVELPKNRAAEDFAPVFLTATQVEALAAGLENEPPLGTLVRFAAYTGLRAAEMSGLRVRDVNLAAGHIEVRQTLKRIAGEWTVGTPKSARSTRNVPLLNRTLIAELRALLVQNPNSGDPDALFWPGRSPHSHRLDWSRPMDTGSVRRYYVVPAARRLGLAEQMRLHDLRHTYASLMLAAGFKPYEVSRYMGHASVSTTDGVYGHLYPTDYNEQIARFEAFVSEA
jgi:integrase